MLAAIFEKIFELLFKSWYSSLSDNFKFYFLKLPIILFIFLMVSIFALTELGFIEKKPQGIEEIKEEGSYSIYIDYDDRIVHHFEVGEKLLCKNNGQRNYVSKKENWDIFWGILAPAKTWSEFANADDNKIYEPTQCKRVLNNKIIANHFYTKIDREKDSEKSLWDKFWEIPMGGLDAMIYGAEDSYRINNHAHIHQFENQFHNNNVFECQEIKLRKSDGWSIIKKDNLMYFTKNDIKFNAINCDEQEHSPW